MAFRKVCTFIPIWGAIWVFPFCRRGTTPKTPLHIKNFTPLGVRNIQQKFQETHADAFVCLRAGQALNVPLMYYTTKFNFLILCQVTQ